MTISQDLRLRVVQKVSCGISRRRAAAHFEVSASSAVRFSKQYEDEGTVALKPRRRRKRRLDPYGEDILSWIKQMPDLTLSELSARLLEAHAIAAPTSTLDDWLRSRNISFKKNRPRQ